MYINGIVLGVFVTLFVEMAGFMCLYAYRLKSKKYNDTISRGLRAKQFIVETTEDEELDK